MLARTISFFDCQCDLQFLSDRDFGNNLFCDLLKDMSVEGEIFTNQHKGGYFCSIYFNNAEVRIISLADSRELKIDLLGKDESRLNRFYELLKKVFIPINIKGAEV